MNLFLITIESVSILLGFGFIGFWIIKSKIKPITILKSLNPLALDIALPCMIFIYSLSLEI